MEPLFKQLVKPDVERIWLAPRTEGRAPTSKRGRKRELRDAVGMMEVAVSPALGGRPRGKMLVQCRLDATMKAFGSVIEKILELVS